MAVTVAPASGADAWVTVPETDPVAGTRVSPVIVAVVVVTATDVAVAQLEAPDHQSASEKRIR